MVKLVFCVALLFFSNRLSAQTDTRSQTQAPTFATEGEREAFELQRLFRDHYAVQTYPAFRDSIVWLAAGTYRFGPRVMRMDPLPGRMEGLLSAGLLYPGLVEPPMGGADTLLITNIVELTALSPSPQVKRFSCWVFAKWMLNPISYVFELTNLQASPNADMRSFIHNARLTFLEQTGVII
jgi:hypothetical protein